MTVPVPTSTGMFLYCDCNLNFTGDLLPDETKGCRTLLPAIQFDVFPKSDHCNIMHIFRKETNLSNHQDFCLQELGQHVLIFKLQLLQILVHLHLEILRFTYQKMYTNEN